MKRFSTFKLVLVILMVVGLSLAILGCDGDSPTKPVKPTPTPIPPPTTKTLLDVDVVVNANTDCEGINFCEDDGLTFNVPEARKAVNVSVTGAANLTLFVYVINPDDEFVVAAASGSFSFEPTKTGDYRLWVGDANEVGGTIHVTIIQ